MKTRECNECVFADMSGERLKCDKGHKPRFYMPKSEYPFSCAWGWKRKCSEWKAGEPKGIIKFNAFDKLFLKSNAKSGRGEAVDPSR